MNHSFFGISIPKYEEPEMNVHGHEEIVLVLVRSEFRKFFLVFVRSKCFVEINEECLNSEINKATIMRIASLDEKRRHCHHLK